MANIKSAIKRIRQSERRRIRNAAVRTSVRTAVKGVRGALESGVKDDARLALARTIQILDKAATKGVLHKNTASRKKSRLARQLNALAAK